MHCLSAVCMRRRLCYSKFLTALPSAWCLVHPWRLCVLPACDHACLESAEPMGLRCGGVRRLKGSPSRDSFACLEMRKTRLCWGPVKHAWRCMTMMNPLVMPHQMTPWESILLFKRNFMMQKIRKEQYECVILIIHTRILMWSGYN